MTVAVAALAALPASFLTIRGLLRTPAVRHFVAAAHAHETVSERPRQPEPIRA